MAYLPLRTNSVKNIFPQLVLLLFGLVNIILSLPPKEELLVILHNPTLSYPLRQRLKLGSPLFEYINFILDRTSPQSVVVIPPQTVSFGMIGNYFFMKSALYPRKVINGSFVQTIPVNTTHILIVQNYSGQENFPFIWPENFDSKKAIYLDDSHKLGIFPL